MDTRLIELLVCPLCKGPLTRELQADELVCPADRLAFPIRDGMAVMLEHEARSLDAPSAPSASVGTSGGEPPEAGTAR